MKPGNRFFKHERMRNRDVIKEWIETAEKESDKELLDYIFHADLEAEQTILGHQRYYIAILKDNTLTIGVIKPTTSAGIKFIEKQGGKVVAQSQNILQFTRELREYAKGEAGKRDEMTFCENGTHEVAMGVAENMEKKTKKAKKKEEKKIKETKARVEAQAPQWMKDVINKIDEHTGILNEGIQHPTRTVFIMAAEGRSLILAGGDMVRVAKELLQFIIKDDMRPYVERAKEEMLMEKNS